MVESAVCEVVLRPPPLGEACGIAWSVREARAAFAAALGLSDGAVGGSGWTRKMA